MSALPVVSGRDVVKALDQFALIRHLAGEVANVEARTAIVEPVRVALDGQGEIVERTDCDADDTFYASFQTHSGVTGTLTRENVAPRIGQFL